MRRFLLFATLVAAGVLPALSRADPPERVARLAVVEGAVSVVPADDESWDDAAPNRPLVAGDRIETGPGARAVVEFDTGVAYLGSDSSLAWHGDADGATRLELPAGTLRLDAESGGEGPPLEVRTPDVAFTVEEPGTFRFDALPGQGETSVAIRAGAGTARSTDGQRHPLTAAQAYRFAAGVPRYAGEPLPAPDAFDSWAIAAGARYGIGHAREYVPDGVVGYRELGRYGEWQEDPDYGPLWYPRAVDDGWAPYRNGYWSWVAPWGWTWMDAAPWGFAPFHYGRWVYVRHHHHRRPRWAWAPGPRHRRVCYAPALVGFVRPAHGHHHRHAPVGWFPLGPRDIYRPAYRASDGHYLRVNAGAQRWHDERALRAARHRHDGPDAYAHARHERGVTFADARDFGAGPGLRTRVRGADRAALGAVSVAADPGVGPARREAGRRAAEQAAGRPDRPSRDGHARRAPPLARTPAHPAQVTGEPAPSASRRRPATRVAADAAAARPMETHPVTRGTLRTDAAATPRRAGSRHRPAPRMAPARDPFAQPAPRPSRASTPGGGGQPQPAWVTPRHGSAASRSQAGRARPPAGRAYARPDPPRVPAARPPPPTRAYQPPTSVRGHRPSAERPARALSGPRPPWRAPSSGFAPGTRAERAVPSASSRSMRGRGSGRGSGRGTARAGTRAEPGSPGRAD